jgi:hypothetical protein
MTTISPLAGAILNQSRGSVEDGQTLDEALGAAMHRLWTEMQAVLVWLGVDAKTLRGASAHDVIDGALDCVLYPPPPPRPTREEVASHAA